MDLDTAQAIGTLVGPAVAAAAALTGVSLTQRSTIRQSRELREEQRRDVRRRVIVDVLVKGRELTTFYDILILVAGKRGVEGMDGYPDTDSGKRLTDVRRAFTEAVTTARLSIPDGESAAAPLRNVESLFNEMADKAMDPPLQAHRSGTDPIAGVIQGMGHLRRFRASLQELEAASATQLTAHLALKRQPPWHRARRFATWFGRGGLVRRNSKIASP